IRASFASFVCTLRVAEALPLATSHSLIVSSPLAEARVLPSGLYAKEMHVVPRRSPASPPVTTSHSLIILSLPPEARVLPSGLKARDQTSWVCPWRVARSLGCWVNSDQSGTRPSWARPSQPPIKPRQPTPHQPTSRGCRSSIRAKPAG